MPGRAGKLLTYFPLMPWEVYVSPIPAMPEEPAELLPFTPSKGVLS